MSAYLIDFSLLKNDAQYVLQSLRYLRNEFPKHSDGSLYYSLRENDFNVSRTFDALKKETSTSVGPVPASTSLRTIRNYLIQTAPRELLRGDTIGPHNVRCDKSTTQFPSLYWNQMKKHTQQLSTNTPETISLFFNVDSTHQGSSNSAFINAKKSEDFQTKPPKQISQPTLKESRVCKKKLGQSVNSCSSGSLASLSENEFWSADETSPQSPDVLDNPNTGLKLAKSTPAPDHCYSALPTCITGSDNLPLTNSSSKGCNALVNQKLPILNSHNQLETDFNYATVSSDFRAEEQKLSPRPAFKPHYKSVHAERETQSCKLGESKQHQINHNFGTTLFASSSNSNMSPTWDEKKQTYKQVVTELQKALPNPREKHTKLLFSSSDEDLKNTNVEQKDQKEQNMSLNSGRTAGTATMKIENRTTEQSAVQPSAPKQTVALKQTVPNLQLVPRAIRLLPDTPKMKQILDPFELQQKEVSDLAARLEKMTLESTKQACDYTKALEHYLVCEDTELANNPEMARHLFEKLASNSEKRDLLELRDHSSGFYLWTDRELYVRFAMSSASSLKPDAYFSLHRSIYDKLYDYQRIAVAWMFELFKRRSGGILADEMGLGKTVQVCAFLRGLIDCELASHVLVCLPLTLLEEWRSHLATWTPNAHCLLFHGSKTDRNQSLQFMSRTKNVIVLTTYETFRNSSAELCAVRGYSKGFSQRLEEEASNEELQIWDVAILDEAHKIKNNRNMSAQALRKLQCKCRILLTGTPLTNTLDDLWNLMDFANPGLLGQHAYFKMRFSDPIKAGSARDASRPVLARKERIVEELSRLVQPYFLRRSVHATLTKRNSNPPAPMEALEITTAKQKAPGTISIIQKKSLEKKTDIVVWIELTPTQEQIYKEILATRHIRDLINTRKPSSSKKGFYSLRAIATLQKLCRHPILLLPPSLQFWNIDSTQRLNRASETAEADSDSILLTFGEEAVSQTKWFKQLTQIDQQDVELMRSLSAKLMFLHTVFPAMEAENHRCLVFSQSLKMLDLIEVCSLQPLGLDYLRVDGTMPQDMRIENLRRFIAEPQIFAMLMTTKVGGQGLNLTCADRVIVVDPDWTPANDNQAVARVHRLGQHKSVVVYRMFTSGAIEDHAFRLQLFKQDISNLALNEANQKMYFTKEDMRQIFTLHSRGSLETHKILCNVNPENQQNDQAINRRIREDLGHQTINELSKFVSGFSDFGILCQDLPKAKSAFPLLNNNKYQCQPS